MMLSQWQRDALLVIVDHKGNQLRRHLFSGQGFTQIRCMEGGIDAWSLSKRTQSSLGKLLSRAHAPPLKHPSPYHDPLRLL